MRAKLATLNHCAVPFLSRTAVNLCWYYHIRSRCQPPQSSSLVKVYKKFVHSRMWFLDRGFTKARYNNYLLQLMHELRKKTNFVISNSVEET